MNDDRSPHDAPAPGARVFDSVEQRRQLLKAVVATGALGGVGAAQASIRPYCKKSGSSHNYHPSASAVGSIIGSVTGTQPPVYGHNCNHYRTSGNWPTNCTNGRGRTLSYNLCANQYAGTKLRFWLVFEFTSQPSTSAMTYRECWDLLANYPSSAEAIWLTAMFNANKLASTFPYNPSGIIDLYNSKNPAMGGMVQSGLNTKALELFRDYLSQAA